MTLTLWVTIDPLGNVMTGYRTFHKAPEQKPHYKMQFGVIFMTFFVEGCLISQQGYSQCSLSSTESSVRGVVVNIPDGDTVVSELELQSN